MSQRIAKVESLVRQVVAGELVRLPDSGRLTVTAVDVSPDMRQADVWIGVIAQQTGGEAKLFETVIDIRPQIQAAVARKMVTKFVPKIHLKHDIGGEYATHIGSVINKL